MDFPTNWYETKLVNSYPGEVVEKANSGMLPGLLTIIMHETTSTKVHHYGSDDMRYILFAATAWLVLAMDRVYPNPTNNIN